MRKRLTKALTLVAMSKPSEFSEFDRISAIRKSGLLDGSGKQHFDHLTEHVRVALDVPVAIISIVDEHRQVFAGHCGLPAPWDARGETPMTHSFCQYVVQQNAPLIVTDANIHALVQTNHAIADLGVIGYLGVPIHLPTGELVGALAAIDTKPRHWTERELDTLNSLAKIVEREITVGISELKYRRLYEDMQEGYFIARAVRGGDGAVSKIVFEEVNPAFKTLTGLAPEDVVGKDLAEVFPSAYDDVLSLYEGVLRTGEPVVHTNAVPAFGRWYENRVRRLDGDRLASVLTDITERKKREAQDDILHQELAHRLKNTLATVQAIASQTLRPVEDRLYVEAFEQRLLTLSSAHDILFQRNWEAASIQPVIAGVLDKLGMGERVHLQGPDMEMGPRATLSTSLILHELATNAIKYGALSNDTGRVELHWTTGGDGEDAVFTLEWREAGGPPVSTPSSRGFGSRLIRMGLTGTGGVSVDYPPDGVIAVMSAPIAELRED